MLRCDLTDAGVNWRKNAKGEVVDFHALRHTFGTRHAKSCLHPQRLMKLMRHSDINLTMEYYIYYEIKNLQTGINALPSLQRDNNTVTQSVTQFQR